MQTKPDPRFERRGPYLWARPTIEVTDAVLGASLDVPTLDGDVKVTIPPGTQPDTVLRLHGEGLPKLHRGARGDLYLSVDVHIPTKLTKDQRKLFERLRDLGPKD